MTRQKGANLWHYYVSSQVFSWRTKNSYIWCIITWKSRFSHDAPKRCSFVALLPGKADFLRTRQNSANLVHYYAEKQVFSRRNRKQSANLLHYNVLKQVFSWRAKTLIFDALRRGKAGFLMTRQKGAHLLHYYLDKQIFSWHAKKVQIWCIITRKSRFSHDATENKVQICCIIMFWSRFSHDAPKTLIFDALIHWKSRFTRDAPKYAYIWCTITC